MFLTATNVFHYLRDAGQVSAADVIAGDYALTEVGRRNRNFTIQRTRAPSLFVKQVPVIHAETTGSLRREAACAQLAQEASPGTVLASVLPRLRRYDPAAHVLVYELIEPGESFAEFAGHAGPPGPDLAAAWGATLAACHVETARPGALVRIASVLTGEPPWVLLMAERPETVMPNINAGRREVVEAIRRTPELAGGLADLRAGWRRLCLMHGDLKWDNVLVSGPADGERELRLLDWELADLGEPLWDVAAGLCSFPSAFILQQPAGTSIEALRSALAAGVVTMHPASRAFWDAYMDAAGTAFPPDARTSPLAARLAAARFVLLAFELLPDAQTITPPATLALEMARYLFVEPERAMADLFGLDATRRRMVPSRGGAIARMPWLLGQAA